MHGTKNPEPVSIEEFSRAKTETSIHPKEIGRTRALLTWLATALLFSVLALLCCEVTARLIVFLGKPSICENGQYDSKYLVADSIRAGNDNILLCGDSLMKQGIYPELLESKLREINKHIRVVNLAVNGGTQQDTIDYLEFLKAKNIHPRIVIYDYEVATSGYSNPGQIAKKSNYLFSGMLSRPKDFREMCSVVPADVSFLVRERGGIKHLLMDFVQSVPNTAKFQRKTFREFSDLDFNQCSLSGMAPEYRLSSAADAPYQEKLIHSFYELSPRSGHQVFESEVYLPLIRYCQLNEIPLVLAWLPHQTSIYEKHWYMPPYTEQWFHQKFLGLARERFIFPLYLDGLKEDPAFYYDFRHLSAYGCLKATELLAEEVKKAGYKALLTDFSLPVSERK